MAVNIRGPTESSVEENYNNDGQDSAFTTGYLIPRIITMHVRTLIDLETLKRLEHDPTEQHPVKTYLRLVSEYKPCILVSTVPFLTYKHLVIKPNISQFLFRIRSN